ncbi:HAD family hydrolase [Stappia sp.]|uniref:HAD family hydrolase n=1 Tax=Stappia sp. TaxID=1870903 RepID=UPI003C7C0326
MRIKAVLFDRDGTLTDFDRTWGPAIAAVLTDLAAGDAASLATLSEMAMFDVAGARFTGPSSLKVQAPADYSADWARVLGETDPDAMLARIEATLLEHATLNVTPFPGVVDTLRGLHEAGLPVGLATNGTEASARVQMEALGVGHAFGFLAGYDSGFGRKPAPGQLLAFARHTGLDPAEIAMVGDSLHDMHAARDAGMIRIAVTTGAVTRADLEPEADLVLDEMRDLLAVALAAESVR